MRCVRGTMKATALLAALAVGLGACSDSPKADQGVVGEAASVFPGESLQDWASYADQLSVVKVIGEEEVPPPKEVFERGEGYIGRSVSLNIERTLWVSEGVQPVNDDISFFASGWVLENGKRRLFSLNGGPRLKKGSRYLMPLVLLDGKWAPLTNSSVYPVDPDGRLESTGGELDGDVAEKSAEAVAAELRNTEPDPVAKKHRHLRGRDRIRAVQSEKG